MKMKPLPSQERLHELFYCVNGRLIRKVRTANRTHIGDVVGSLNNTGRLVVAVDKERYLVSRLVWKYYYGTDPEHEIDHIDWNPLNNNPWNLRDITQHENKSHRRVSVERGFRAGTSAYWKWWNANRRKR